MIARSRSRTSGSRPASEDCCGSSRGSVATPRGRAGMRARHVSAVFEDRDGNLWVGTDRGIERWRDRVFTTYLGRRACRPMASAHVMSMIGRTHVVRADRAAACSGSHDGQVVSRVSEAGLDRRCRLLDRTAAATRSGSAGSAAASRASCSATAASSAERLHPARRAGAGQRLRRASRARRRGVGRHAERAARAGLRRGPSRPTTPRSGLASNTVASIARRRATARCGSARRTG